MDNRTATIVLNMLPGIGPLRVNQLLTLYGTPSAIFSASRDELARVPGIGGHFAERIRQWQNFCDIDAELELVERGGVTLITRDESEYPELLHEIHDPPLCLYVRGDVSALRTLKASVAIVGSRRTTRYGISTAGNLGTAAALAGWTVVSGLARGIDTVAHQAVLDSEGCTVAVLGSGLAHLYPQENVDLARRIAGTGGALVSELPMRYRPDRRTFPMRNRIISGMTRGTIVVEAGTRSGSLITASQALDQNRQVFAVPGRVDSPQSRGCHQLIKEGAVLVENFHDVLAEFSFLPGLTAEAGTSLDAEASKAGEGDFMRAGDLQLTETETKLLAFIDRDERAIDDLISTVGEPTGKVLSALVALEMRHLVRQLPGKRVVRTDSSIVG